MTGWQMYWLLMLDNISVGFWTATVTFLICTIIKMVVNCADSEFYEHIKLTFVMLAATGFFWIFAMLTPTTKQMAAIIVVPQIVNNEDVQKLPANLVELANEWVETKTKELKGESK